LHWREAVVCYSLTGVTLWTIILGDSFFAATPFWRESSTVVGVVVAAVVALYAYFRIERHERKFGSTAPLAIMFGAVVWGYMVGFVPASSGVPMIAAAWSEHETVIEGAVTERSLGSSRGPSKLQIYDLETQVEVWVPVSKAMVSSIELDQIVQVSGRGNALFFRVERIEPIER
ncbi:MAG: hypothetical protein AAFX00_11795, partial [Pseudomonadota bacterium]